jgi:hypothetical protein
LGGFPCEVGGEGQGEQQKERVRQMNRHPDRALRRQVMRDQVVVDQILPDPRLESGARERGEERPANRVLAAAEGVQPAADERHHEKAVKLADLAVRRFDKLLNRRSDRYEFSVAERPVTAAAVAGAGGADNRADADNEQIP